MTRIQHVYIIGSKGIPAKYGGFETFVEQLTKNKKSQHIKYHVSCLNIGDNLYGDGKEHFIYNNTDCFNIRISKKIGPAKAILYDIESLKKSIEIAKENKDSAPIFYILACRIGPFLKKYLQEIHSIGGRLLVNPDGHEWLREKWSTPVQKYWKYSESLMVKYADLLICDSENIERYIHNEYNLINPKTTYISYGTDLKVSILKSEDSIVRSWYAEKNIKEKEYFLVVGRFVPENNYEAMIKEFMRSKSEKDFVLITNVEKNKFYEKLRKQTNFDKDKRIKFVGTVYNQELLKYVREHAFAYLHGHEVGGTNPSLLEAMATTPLNLLLHVNFNEEVGADGVMYWEKNNLNEIIDESERLTTTQVENMKKKARHIIRNKYNWNMIVSNYEELFLKEFI